MYKLRDTLNTENTWFPDPAALGTFIDNHDNPRFLNLNPSWVALKAALAFGMFS
jgi:alpha-amylase